ncbi:MAG TPA: hypothetical protein IAD47_06230 [Candidatus Limihabitans stercoravium]|nr:hypothetical protein [Candidatus Limihabitans stercoravium]
MIRYFKENYFSHPLMRVQDFMKLIYQAEFGCEHCMGANNENLIKNECLSLTADDNVGEPLFEQISEKFARVNLVPYTERGYSFNTLSDMMKKVGHCGSIEGYRSRVNQLLESVSDGTIDLDFNAAKRYIAPFLQEARPVHHSVSYRMNYRPHYRVVLKQHAVLVPLIAEIDNLLYRKLNVVVAIDGKCGSGKSTYAEVLSNYYNFCTVIHCDDFFLPPEMRTDERLAEVGGNIHYERLQGVLNQVRQDKPFIYQRYSCADNRMYDVSVEPKRLIVLEGSYSSHPKLRQYIDLCAMFTVSDSDQRLRLSQREGREKFKVFQEKWIPLENRYFSTVDTSDMVTIDTSGIEYS